MVVSATAPGKVVLLGEYSVLEGGPAVAMAINRSVQVEVKEKAEGLCTICAPALNLPIARFSLAQDGDIRWQDDGHRYYGILPSVTATLAKHQALQPLPHASFDICLDSRALFHKGSAGRLTKLGLGSSAALTTALASALVEYTGQGQWSDVRWMTILIEAHRLFQKYEGSGVDVVASLYGGVIEYKQHNGRPRAKPLILPGELELVFVWSGQPASTPGLLRRLRSWQHRHGTEYAKVMNELSMITSDTILAAARDDCAVFVEYAGRFASVLAELGERAGLEMFSSAHIELSTMAKSSGLVYKPCGAGGGDVGVAMGADVNDVKRFVNLMRNSDYQVIDINPSPTGVRTIRSQ